MKNHEGISNNHDIADSFEQNNKKPAFPGDPNQYTEAELMADPAKRYHVNPDEMPIFSRQTEMGPNWGDTEKTIPIDEAMSRYVTSTADTIAVLAGEDSGFKNPSKIPAADHVIYLDKSARPVSWLVNVFWDAFSDKKRPEHSYLAIDRKEWFPRTGTNLIGHEYVRDPDGSMRVATFSDFKTENVTPEHLARIRALFIPGGIETEDIDEIMKTPTKLDGKNITIIDEVSRSGSTINIAKYLIAAAIPEAASVNGHVFWDAKIQTSPVTGELQMRSHPVWYNSNISAGRGIGDVDDEFFKTRYEKYPNPKTRAQKFGSFVLGTYVDLSDEIGNSSRELAQEIKLMRKEWDAGHIFMLNPSHYDSMKWREHVMEQGVQFSPQKSGQRIPKNSYLGVINDITGRAPTPRYTPKRKAT